MANINQHSLYKHMEVDTALSSIFKIYFKKFVSLFLVSFLGVFIIQMTFYQLGINELSKISNPDELFTAVFNMRIEILIGTLVYFVVYGLLMSILVNYIIKNDDKSNINIGSVVIESVTKYGIHVIFFVLLSTIMLVVGSVLGIIILIIGIFFILIYLATVLAPGMGIIVAEGKNALEAIGRSFNLTHKDFWPSLGIVVLFALILILIVLVLMALTAIPYIFIFLDAWKETGSFTDIFNKQFYDIGIWAVIINSIVSGIVYPLYAIVSVVLYFRLKFMEDKKNTVV